MSVPTIRLNNGYDMPIIGLGTLQIPRNKARQVILQAIDSGYRHFDCAIIYNNEAEIGQGLKRKIIDGTVKRKDLFITSKLWNTHHSKHQVRNMLQKSLLSLGLEYLDLYLMHWPMGFKEETNHMIPHESGKIDFSDIDYLETWRAMEKCVRMGLVRSIGVSNFNAIQLLRLIQNCAIMPVTNQIECNPRNNQKLMIQFCQNFNIVVTAYCPLEKGDVCPVGPMDKRLIHEELLEQLSHKYQKSVVQMILRYLIQINTVPLPKTGNKSRLEENINIFDFEITEEDLVKIDGLNKNIRHYLFIEAKDHEHYPFNIQFT